MARIYQHELEAAIIDALGLPPDNVTAITISLAADRAPKVTVEMEVLGPNLELERVIRTYLPDFAQAKLTAPKPIGEED